MSTFGVDLARALDPARIGADVGLELDPWQRDLLRSDAKRILMNCCRQSGKSTCACLIALSTVIQQPHALVLMLSVSQRQSSELFRTLMGFARQVPGAPAIQAESALRCEWANGSRVLALPGTERTTRGYAGADLVIIDEAARVEDELLAAVRPTMATKANARLIALSTPFGKRGWWYEAWTGDEPWHRIKVSASDCPRISKEFLAEELRTLGALRFSEEYELQFVDDITNVFSTTAIDRCFTHDVRPLWG
jgi:Terminase large subunit, T4likevirus-type, N-terminal